MVRSIYDTTKVNYVVFNDQISGKPEEKIQEEHGTRDKSQKK